MPDADKMNGLLELHLQQYKNLKIQDVYKLLYQGAFGAEHILLDVKKAHEWFYQEWGSVPPLENEPALIPVSLDGTIVRANFRPCKARGMSSEEMWHAFVASAGKAREAGDMFEHLWTLFVQLCQSSTLPFDAGLAEEFGREAKSSGYPARHHSQAYRNANKPAYRVLEAAELKQFL